jgi:hypothetical protein
MSEVIVNEQQIEAEIIGDKASWRRISYGIGIIILLIVIVVLLLYLRGPIPLAYHDTNYENICLKKESPYFDNVKFNYATIHDNNQILCVFDNNVSGYIIEDGNIWKTNPEYSVCYKMFHWCVSCNEWLYDGQKCGGKR